MRPLTFGSRSNRRRTGTHTERGEYPLDFNRTSRREP
jgi:hypothetical protein